MSIEPTNAISDDENCRDRESSDLLAILVDSYGDYLFRYAMAHVRNEHVVEDLLQETFLAAIRSIDRFDQRASRKTWLTSILRNKIVDYFRQQARSRTTPISQVGTEPPLPKTWKLSAGSCLENEEFWRVLHECLNKLPPTLITAFQLREIDEWDAETICETLQISNQNLAVRLFRAREALRSCLSANWFSKG